MQETPHILPITWAVLGIVFSYLIGSIPMGLIVSRIAGGIDIREHGSGNIGLTNVIRTLGWGPGLATGILDFIKGYLPVFIAMRYFSPQDFARMSTIYETIVLLVASGLMLGNLYPVYLLFRGGKGVATGFGVLSALMGVYIFIPIAIFGVILFIFRFVSLASMVACISVPLVVLFLNEKLPIIGEESTSGLELMSAFTWCVAILLVWKHRSNIVRIYAGTEPRIGRLKEPEIPSLAAKLAKQKEEAEKATEVKPEGESTEKPEGGESEQKPEE